MNASLRRSHPWIGAALLAACCAASVAASAASPRTAAASQGSSCVPAEVGLKLPAGFCVTIFADGIGHSRDLAVAPNGVVYVNIWSGSYYGNDLPHAGGFLVALQDTTGAGKANIIERFGETVQTGGAGGTGIGIYHDGLYAEINERIVRYTLTPGSIVPQGAAVPVVTGLPLTGDHPMHPFGIDSDGMLYVDVATATNACQVQNRTPGSPGHDPCTELQTRGGVWRFDANKTNQAFSPAARYATGIRNAEGYGIDTAGHRIFVTQHGRDQLHTNWPSLYKPTEEATLPAEEVLLLKQGGDYGWPECYYDGAQRKLVLAPEYGGDGGKKVGPCADKTAPVAAFPAHWAPNSMVFYDHDQFPAHYHHGLFIAFHGSWNRAPYPQGGYNIVFQPMAGDHAAGRCQIFADGFAGEVKSPDKAWHRPSGLAIGADGSLYVADDVRGRIYHIVYRGGPGSRAGTAGLTPCPSATAPAGKIVVAVAGPPEGTHPDAGAADFIASLPVAEGATRQTVALGARIYHGQVGGAPCTGCHGADGTGTVLGPNLTAKQWLWGDGSYAAIIKTITAGVPQPKQYRAAMPPMGGAQLTPAQVSAVAAYVWGLSHRN
jgi:glucose/arabinose dehydrogenase/mono/diheme cytochrome c family protein